jgi:hypothetical protein
MPTCENGVEIISIFLTSLKNVFACRHAKSPLNCKSAKKTHSCMPACEKGSNLRLLIWWTSRILTCENGSIACRIVCGISDTAHRPHRLGMPACQTGVFRRFAIWGTSRMPARGMSSKLRIANWILTSSSLGGSICLIPGQGSLRQKKCRDTGGIITNCAAVSSKSERKQQNFLTL